MIKRLLTQFTGCILFCFLVTGCSSTRVSAPFAGYPGELVDPALVCGVLPNGFQYVLLENHTPADRVSMHLNVFAGSANETDEEQGLAHYLEHMLFNGSTHFKPGELIEFFQSIGMGFGADANASTSYFTTIYDLNLPRGDTAHLKDALLVFQDYAQGALLLEEEVDRERGIILAEKRDRDSVPYQMFKKKLAFQLPGSLVNQRHPIGLEQVIEQADSSLLRNFYHKWYRPGNMALVAVGDFDAKNLEALLIEVFSEGSDPRLSENEKTPAKNFVPDTAWEPHKKGIKTFYHYDPEAQTTTISIERIQYRPFVNQTLESMKQELAEDIGHQILSRRLLGEIRNQKIRFSSASAFSGQFLQNVFLTGIGGEYGDADHWQTGVQELESFLRQAMKYGFTQEELDREKAESIARIKADAKQAETRETSVLARHLLSAINKKKLFLSPAQRQEVLIPFIQSLSLEQVHEAFVKTWGNDHRLISVTGNAVVPEDNGKIADWRIAQAYEKAAKIPVQPLPASRVKKFPYLPVPGQDNPQTLARILRTEENVNDLGITIVDFTNKVRLNIRHNDFQKHQMIFSLIFGNGLQGQPDSKSGLGLLGEATVEESGFGSMDTHELEQALAGHNLSMNFSVDETCFSLGGSGAADELELVFQFIYTFLTDPGFSPQALELAKFRYEQDFRGQEHTTEGSYRIKGIPFLAGEDPRFGLPHPEIINEYTLEDVKNWLGPYIRSSPVELSIVGDVDPEKVLAYAKVYLGGLENRNDLPVVQHHPVDFPGGKHLDLLVDTRMEKAMVRLCFLTDDYWDIGKTRRLSVLARVFSERLRKTIREELGVAYSPYAYNHPSKGSKGYGVFQAVAMVAPADRDRVSEALEDIARDLYKNGVEQEELDLVRKSLMEHLKVAYTTNDYWLRSVLEDSFRFPQKLQWPMDIMEDYARITSEELSKLAAECLNPDSGAWIRIFQKNFE